ncbi:putative F-box protein At5g62660 [Papaver somniferum]|uniref:putative F-box protein At5g62660 n=1 Tax=Papaver somniferum TaxID=3469 RepID=UPI000E701796|nr:putative F-box protein At5g62660 [Papaver somniferum]
MMITKRYGVADPQILASLENFDDDILCEILTRVPARLLVRSCKFVCKRWLSLIRSPHFLELHRIRSQTRRPSLIFSSTTTDYIIYTTTTEFFSVEESLFEDSRALNATPLMTPTMEECMLVSSSGLLFCLIDSLVHNVRIYNPCTGEITASIGKTNPIEGQSYFVAATYGFGFHPSSKKHKLVRVWDIRTLRNGRLAVAEVLTVGEDDTWRKINEVPPFISETPAVSLNGSIYWISSSASTVGKYKALVAFDMESEIFREISIPKSLLEETKKIKLLEVDGCVAIFQKISEFEVKFWIFNGNWTEEIISMPIDWDSSSIDIYQTIQQLPGTDIIIIKAKRTRDDAERHLVSVYQYDITKKTFDKVKIIGLPTRSFSPGRTGLLTRLIDYGFFTMFDSLYPVRKQHQS